MKTEGIYHEAVKRLGLKDSSELPKNKERVIEIVEEIEYSKYDSEEIKEFFDYVLLSKVIK